jgi:hypothetical protein
LESAEKLACESSQDFFILMTELHTFYEKQGFKQIIPAPTQWLAIEDQASHSLTKQDLSDYFMVKQLSGKRWLEGEIDFLGYLF